VIDGQDSRAGAVTDFLQRHGYGAARFTPLAQDASLRRYLRLAGGPRPAILMDAPPPEDVRPFRRIAVHLAAIGLSVPEIIAADEPAGLLLEEDLGDDLFSAVITVDTAPTLFDSAVDALVALQSAASPADVPAWDAEAMSQATLGVLFDWWWPAAFGTVAPAPARADFAAALTAILAPLGASPGCLVHRDYFAGNLVWLPRREGVRRVGILDFQGAAIGHPAYDLVSLLQDARRDIPAAIEVRAIERYLTARPELDRAAFRTAYAVCAAQRHLRVATQWVRLARREGRPQYLIHGPRTWRLLDVALRHPATTPLAAALDRWIPPARRGNPPGLAA
jgi:hypothetical protein